ncbi:CPBP family intramembrane glutamic endopeptidase [Mycobacterium sp. EPa45]|uniref:Rv0804 family intramembrane glutamic endopeptidase n=1 Tax=Mycobacterium sp. EPa45 TaxID=1545728 RepID=UPI000641F867|nr:CPBP family intramembrane glutamic endopeptidase [Mycobacterium sp. EPa45]AKK29451.1 abortive phage infection protein [Mycobacterium sp. EPa45]
MITKDSGTPAVRAIVSTGLAVAVGTSLGLRPPQLWSGLRTGGVAAGVAATAIAALTAAVPRVRRGMNDRRVPAHPVRWLVLEIPVATAWTEEMLFRGALQTLAVRALGPTAGPLLQAAAFGLWHIPDARRVGDPVLGTVLVTGVAGWVFGWLAKRSGSVLAPTLAHVGFNESAAVAAMVVQRR